MTKGPFTAVPLAGSVRRRALERSVNSARRGRAARAAGATGCIRWPDSIRTVPRGGSRPALDGRPRKSRFDPLSQRGTEGWIERRSRIRGGRTEASRTAARTQTCPLSYFVPTSHPIRHESTTVLGHGGGAVVADAPRYGSHASTTRRRMPETPIALAKG